MHTALSLESPVCPPRENTVTELGNKADNRCRHPVLDLARSVAALLVVAGHLRPLLFVDYGELAAASPFLQAFYYLTGFAFEAVIVFFVLSGYLVGGAVTEAREAGFWPGYLLRRLTRLGVVLVPCLIATFILNCWGRNSGGAEFLSGKLGSILLMAPPVPVALDVTTFAGNILFLQTILVPVFGDNRPLWSLANEFWYYLLFPLLYWAFRRRTGVAFGKKAVCIGLALMVLYFMPPTMRLGFVVWCLGVIVFVLNRRYSLSASLRAGGAVVAMLVCFWVFHRSRVSEILDLWLGLAFASVLFFTVRWGLPFVMFKKAAERLADFSYTLYLSHFSLMAFIWYTFLGAKRVQPTAGALLVYAGVFGLLILYAYGLYWLFERNTPFVRRWFSDKLGFERKA